MSEGSTEEDKMYVKGRRIRTLERHMSFREGSSFHLGIPITEEIKGRLRQIGFPEHLPNGFATVPTPVGRISTINSEGMVILRKDLPKEPVTHLVWRRWTDWHGNEHSGHVSATYYRFPRENAPPPQNRLIVRRENGVAFITSDALVFAKDATPKNLHMANLLLEIFGEFHVLTESFEKVVRPTRRVSWKMLPPGEIPWDELEKHIDPIVKTVSRADKTSPSRMKILNAYKPDQITVGQDHFFGYVAFTYRTRGITVLESAYYGNATYVFRGDWEKHSQMTKSEIIRGALAQKRLVHAKGWRRALSDLMR